MVPVVPLESNFLVPDATFLVALVVVLALVSLLILVGVLVMVRMNTRARRTAADLRHERASHS